MTTQTIGRLESRMAAIGLRLADLRAELAELEGIYGMSARSSDLWTIADTVCDSRGVTRALLLSHVRTFDVIEKRHIVFYLARKLLSPTLCTIAEAFNRTHGAILHGCQCVQDKMSISPAFKQLVESIEAECRKRLEEVGVS